MGNEMKWNGKYWEYTEKVKKLDGVGPFDNSPSMD